MLFYAKYESIVNTKRFREVFRKNPPSKNSINKWYAFMQSGYWKGTNMKYVMLLFLKINYYVFRKR